MAEQNLKRTRLNLWLCGIALVLIDGLNLDGWEQLLPAWVRYVKYAAYLVFGMTLLFFLLMYYDDRKAGMEKPMQVYVKDRGMHHALVTTILVDVVMRLIYLWSYNAFRLWE